MEERERGEREREREREREIAKRGCERVGNFSQMYSYLATSS